MWRFIFLAALGLVIGSRARSERRVVTMSLLFGLVYGGIEAVSTAMLVGSPSLRRALFLLLLGLVMAAPVYAVAEIWRRTRVRAWNWLRRLIR
jgi:hypothetical protein